MKLFLNIFVSLALLGGGAYHAWWLIASKPLPQKKAHVEKRVNVITKSVQPDSHKMVVPCMGTVIPAKVITVQPEVTGRLLDISPNLVTGGIIPKGEIIGLIDPRNYKFVVEARKADLARAELNLKVEEGRGAVAQREWKLLEKGLKKDASRAELALRKPQIVNVQAAQKAALAGVEKAELDLQRTILKAPFNGLVLTENVEIGQLVNPQTKLATMVDTDKFWVRLAVPVKQLQNISLPDGKGRKGSSVKLIQELANDGESVKPGEWQGKIVRLLGDLETNGRMARLLVEVKDPLALSQVESGHLPLLIGSYVNAKIDCGLVKETFSIPRSAIREGNKIWLMGKGDRLEIITVTILWKDGDNVYLRGGLQRGDKVVTSGIAVPVKGTLLRSVTDKGDVE